MRAEEKQSGFTSVSAENIERWLPQLLQTNDSLFPSGSYAHSFGLEGLVQLGLITDRASLGDFVRDQIVPGMERFELPFVRLAHSAAQDGKMAQLLALDERYGAMKSAFELRQASIRIGSQRLEMLQKLMPHPLLERLECERAAGRFQAHAPIVFGAQSAVSETPIEAALLSYYYQNLAGLISASMKLIRMGQIAGQLLLTERLVDAGAVIERSMRISEENVGWFQPTLDIASARHEKAYTRVFIS